MLSLNQEIKTPNSKNISLFIKREDLLYPDISGNKYRKLKYNLLEAQSKGYSKLLTFGGAFSNHIAAVAFAGKKYGFQTIGIIRGEELGSKISENPTLLLAQENGMQFDFVSRSIYCEKDNQDFLNLLNDKFGSFYLVPEGGTNALAIKGCEEILTAEDKEFTHICCAVGTGGTISGIINSLGENQKALGFPALKGSFLSDDIRSFAKNNRWELLNDYHFGGYGKINEEFIRFLNKFYQTNGIPLDPIYTGKMMFGVLDLIERDFFPENAKILAIHTGGLQGIAGMNALLKKKQMSTIDYI